MKPILFSLFDNKALTESIAKHCQFEMGEIELREFPDEETYVRITSNVENRKIILFASLDRPNPHLLSLLFVAATARDLGAKEIGLVAPYLPYMRQDKRFNRGEGVTSNYSAALLSSYFDWLVTIDPHLHRRKSLNEIFTIPATVLHAANPIANWIMEHIQNPILIGPDKESEQWVAEIAEKSKSPFSVLKKIRKGDQIVEISLPQIDKYKNHQPILIDDIISTARTMIETIKRMKNLKMKAPVCIGVHGIFANNAYQDLVKEGAAQIITCNTVKHISNGIDISIVIADSLQEICHL